MQKIRILKEFSSLGRTPRTARISLNPDVFQFPGPPVLGSVALFAICFYSQLDLPFLVLFRAFPGLLVIFLPFPGPSGPFGFPWVPYPSLGFLGYLVFGDPWLPSVSVVVGRFWS